MFFILSKLLVNFIYPITWIGIALAFAFLFKNHRIKRRCLIAALSILIFFTNTFLLNLFAGFWDIEGKDLKGHYSCAIILGGFVSEDQYGNGYFNSASDRFIQAIKLKNTKKVDHLLFSGGNADINPSAFREATWVKNELKYFGIADSSVLIERGSRNTFENAKFSKTILMSRNLRPPYLLVTSAFHMRRSLQTFKKMNVDVMPYPCNYIAGREKTTISSFIPSADTLLKWNVYIKEVIGYSVYYFKSPS